MAKMISTCSISEKGTTNGEKGDQTGSEYYIRNWYSYPWDAAYWYPSRKVRRWCKRYARRAALNDCVGYGQKNRLTFWKQLKKVKNYDPRNITVVCNADCSSSTAAIVKAVGYRLNIQALKDFDEEATTETLDAEFLKAGFIKKTATKFLDSPDWLPKGAVLLNYVHHVVITLNCGNKRLAHFRNR